MSPSECSSPCTWEEYLRKLSCEGARASSLEAAVLCQAFGIRCKIRYGNMTKHIGVSGPAPLLTFDGLHFEPACANMHYLGCWDSSHGVWRGGAKGGSLATRRYR